MSIIEINNVSKHYVLEENIVKAVDQVNLSIARNEYVAFTGSSGSGKSSLMNILGCLDRPTYGEYILDGRDVSTLSENELAEIRNTKVGFIFQSFNLIPRVSALRNVMQPLVYQRIGIAERREMAAEALVRLGLDERMDHMPHQLSGGQKQRVAIARALVADPAILLADEPTGNLDSKTTYEILNIFGELHADGCTILMVTHEPEVAQRAKRVLEMKDGSIIKDIMQI